MILRSAPPSPFVRMVRLAAIVLGIDNQITIEDSNTLDPNDSIGKQNPLGKIPTLILKDKTVIYDSRIILQYLNQHAKDASIIPSEPKAELIAMIKTSRINGILDAAVATVYEKRFHEEVAHRSEAFINHQKGKIERALAQIAGEYAPYSNGKNPDITEIGLAVTLDYLDLRKPLDWRDHCPQYEEWMQQFADSVPGYKETLPPEIDPAPWRN